MGIGEREDLMAFVLYEHLSAPHPGYPFICGVVQVPVASLRQQLSPRVLYNDECPDDRTGIPGRPADALVGGLVHAFVSDSDYFSIIGN